MDGDWGEEKQKDIKKDLVNSDLPNREPKGVYGIKNTAFIKQETDRWRETGRYLWDKRRQKMRLKGRKNQGETLK